MTDDAAKVHKLLRQRAAVSAFGSFALRQSDLLEVLTEAARVCAEGLNVSFAKVCRYRAAENDLIIEAGHGWQAGVIGHVVSHATANSPQGRAFVTGEPSICNDLRKDNNFGLPSFYATHGIVSTIDVIIKGNGHPYGVLEIDNDQQQDYDHHDIEFLNGFANVLAGAVATSTRTALLQTTIDEMRVLVAEKDRMLDQKRVLAQEMQHRVRNNLQLVYGLLGRQTANTTDEVVQRGLKAIARQITTLAQVYDHLLGCEMTRTTDFGGFVKSLCLSLSEVQAIPDSAVTLTCDSEPLILDLDVVTPLGLVITELVTNSYDHAFDSGKGTIVVSVRRAAREGDMATVTIRDDGKGFKVNPEGKRHGLSLVRRLIEQVHGTAAVAFDHGTVWTVSFPVVDSAPSIRTNA